MSVSGVGKVNTGTQWHHEYIKQRPKDPNK